MLKEIVYIKLKEKEYNELKRLANKVKISQGLNENLLLEKDILQDIKQKVIKTIKEVTDKTILEKVLSILFEEQFTKKINEYFTSKGVDEKTISEFIKIFVLTPGSLTEKMEFLDALTKTGILDGKKILETKSVSKLTDGYFLFTNEFESALYKELKQWKPSLGSKTGVGKGEGLLVAYIKDAIKADKGDLEWNNTKVEVKANSGKSGSSGGRLKGTTNAWGNTVKTWSKLVERLEQENLIKPDTTIPLEPNTLNFTVKSINNWNDLLIEDRNKRIKLFEWIVKDLFPKAKAQDLKWIKDCFDGVDLDGLKFIKEFAIFQFKYYQQEDGFDCVFFLNLATDKFVVVYNEKEYRNLVYKGIIVVGGFSWKEERNLAFQVGLKG